MIINRVLYSLAYIVLLGIPAIILSFLIKDSLNFDALAIVTLISLLAGGVFDIWAVRQKKKDKFFIWEYNSKSILGFKLYGVPVEDFIFFLFLTPIFIITIYEAVKIMSLAPNETSLVSAALIASMLVSYWFVYKYAIRTKNN